MYNPETLTACLAPLLWFRPAAAGNPDTPELAGGLLKPDAHADGTPAAGAVAVQDVHPLLTLRNIAQAAPEDAELSAYLAGLRTAAVAKVLTAFAERKKLTGAGKSIMQDVALSGQSGEYRRKIIKQGRFVGLAVRLRPGTRDVAVSLTGLGTQFTDLNPDFRLYVYHSSSADALATYALPRTSRVYFEWTPVSIALPGEFENGEWCIGYFEDDLVGQAVDLQADWSQRPGTGGCCSSDYLLYDQWAPLVSVRPFAVPAAWAEPTMWSGIVTYQNGTNFGLNLRLSATCDLSDYFCRYAGLFTQALQLQLAVDLLSTMAYSTRNNGVSQAVQQLALVELNNRPDYQPGLLSKLEKALGALDVDLSGVSRPCLPCKTNGVKWGAV